MAVTLGSELCTCSSGPEPAETIRVPATVCSGDESDGAWVYRDVMVQRSRVERPEPRVRVCVMGASREWDCQCCLDWSGLKGSPGVERDYDSGRNESCRGGVIIICAVSVTVRISFICLCLSILIFLPPESCP